MVLSRSAVSDSSWPRGLQPTRLLCPWGFPGKNTGAGWHFPLQGSSRLGDRSCISCASSVGRQTLYRWATWGAPSEPPGEPHLSHLGSPICDSSHLPSQAKPSPALGLPDSEPQVCQISSHCSGSVTLTQFFLELKHTGYLTFWVT